MDEKFDDTNSPWNVLTCRHSRAHRNRFILDILSIKAKLNLKSFFATCIAVLAKFSLERKTHLSICVYLGPLLSARVVY